MFLIGPLVVPLVMAGVQAATGAAQRMSANKRRKKAMEDFNYEIPSAVTEQVQMARERASQNQLPGEDIYRSRMESQAAGTLQKGESVSETASDLLGMYAKMFGQKQDANRDIFQKGAEYKSANQQELMRTMGVMAEAENQKFYYNQYMPFLSDMQFATEESQAGAANVAGGLQTAYSAWLTDWQNKTFEKMYGGDKSKDAEWFGQFFGSGQQQSPESNQLQWQPQGGRTTSQWWDATKPPVKQETKYPSYF